MTDYERVLLAMKMVNKHKLDPELQVWQLEILAETAVKTMYLIDAENERKNLL